MPDYNFDNDGYYIGDVGGGGSADSGNSPAQAGDSGTAGWLNQFLDVASPYARQFVYGLGRQDDNWTQTDANNYGRLNGTGSRDRRAAQDAPNNWRDLLFGNSVSSDGTATASAGKPDYVKLALIGAAVVGAFLLFRKL